MANYYVLFSADIELKNNDEFEWCQSKLKELGEVDVCDEGWMKDFAHELVSNKDKPGGHIWFHTDESGEPSHVAEFVQSFLKRFHRNDVWFLEWSNYCDKARLDAFGGGAVVVTATQMRWMNTNQWACNTVKQLSKVKARSKKKA